MATKANIFKKANDIYNKEGQSAVFAYVKKLDKATIKRVGLRYEHCNGCDTESPAIDHTCLVCGQRTKTSKKQPLFECSLSFTFNADNPLEAAREFISNIQNNPNWFVDVKNMSSKKQYTVDTENGEVEEK